MFIAITPFYADTCFKLTVDLDLGADLGFEWDPVANSYWPGAFCGHFDGDNHSISNLTISNQTADNFGIFGHMVNGSLKNIIVDGGDINVSSIYSYVHGYTGIILGYGENITIENCVNRANVTWERVSLDLGQCRLGGLFGAIENSTITNCHNYGDITAPQVLSMYNLKFCGGIAGWLKNCVVNDCGNYGNITFKGDSQGHCYACGGIAGMMTGTISNCNNNGDLFFEVRVIGSSEDVKTAGGIIGCINSNLIDILNDDQLTINNCYSISDIVVVGDQYQAWSGGILGYVVDNIVVTIENCYYAGPRMLADNIGGIVGYANEQTSESNCYYINSITSQNDYGTPKSEEEMKSQDFVNLLNDGSDIYAMDDMMANHGFPIFAQYYSVTEAEIIDNISIYPNPAQNFINIRFENKSACKSVEIYSLDGRIVKTIQETFQETSLQQMTLDISSLISGVYIMKVTKIDGTVVSYRIIKE